MKKTLALAILLFAGSLCCAQAATGFTKIGNSTTTSFTDTTCPLQTSCYYQVTAVDSTLHESQAGLCSTATLCFATNQVVYQAPSSGASSVTLTWTASGTASVTYNIYQHVGPLPPGNVKAN